MKGLKYLGLLLLLLLIFGMFTVRIVNYISDSIEAKWQQESWQKNTLDLVEQAYQLTGKDKGAFGELPPLEIAKKPDLYTTAWNLQLLRLLGEINKNEPHFKKTIRLLEYLSSPQELLEQGPPNPSLYKAYLLVKCYEALEVKPRNYNKIIEFILKHQNPETGLFELNIGLKSDSPDFGATAMTLEILSYLGFNCNNLTKTSSLLRQAFQDDKNFTDVVFVNNGAPIIVSLGYLGLKIDQFPKDLVVKRKIMLSNIERKFLSIKELDFYNLNLINLLIKNKAFFNEQLHKDNNLIRLVTNYQLINGGFPTGKGIYVFEPHVTYNALFLLKYWGMTIPKREALLKTIEKCKNPSGGWNAIRITSVNPKSTYYALVISKHLKGKVCENNEEDIKNQIKDWIQYWSQKFSNWDPLEQLRSFKDLKFLLLSAELLHMEVDKNQISSIIDTFKIHEALEKTYQPGYLISLWAMYGDVCFYLGKDIPNGIRAKLIEKTRELKASRYGWKGHTFMVAIKDVVSLLKTVSPKELRAQKEDIIRLVNLMQSSKGGFKFATRPSSPDIISTWYAIEIYRNLNVKIRSPELLRDFLKKQVYNEGGFLLLDKKEKNNDLTLETTLAGLQCVGILEAIQR